MPLAINGDLEQAAESHSREMVSADYFQHVSPSGQTPADRIRSSGYIPGPMDGYAIGENLAWGTLGLSTPQAIVQAWIASPEHLANILEGQYRDTGIGVVASVPAALAEGQPGATYTAGVRRHLPLKAISKTGQRRSRPLRCVDQRKEVVLTLADSSYGTLEVTGR